MSFRYRLRELISFFSVVSMVPMRVTHRKELSERVILCLCYMFQKLLYTINMY